MRILSKIIGWLNMFGIFVIPQIVPTYNFLSSSTSRSDKLEKNYSENQTSA